MWEYLEHHYLRDSAYSFVAQIQSFIALSNQLSSSTLSPSSTIIEFITMFEVKWSRLTKLAHGSSENYRKHFASFLSEDKAKRDFMLGFLQPYMKNVVDNLTTKDSLTYAATKRHLLDLSTSPDSVPIADQALYASTSDPNSYTRFRSRFNPASSRSRGSNPRSTRYGRNAANARHSTAASTAASTAGTSNAARTPNFNPRTKECTWCAKHHPVKHRGLN